MATLAMPRARPNGWDVTCPGGAERICISMLIAQGGWFMGQDLLHDRILEQVTIRF